MIIAVTVANSANHTISTAGTSGGGSNGSNAKAKTAGIGSAITLNGNSTQEQMSVTVTKVIASARPGDEFTSAPAGQSYESAIADTVAGCTTFPATENIAPGSSGLGCIVFEVPKAANIKDVQFTLDSGMGPDTGQWNVTGRIEQLRS